METIFANMPIAPKPIQRFSWVFQHKFIAQHRPLLGGPILFLLLGIVPPHQNSYHQRAPKQMDGGSCTTM
jgi:hypothetical protein